MKRFFVALTACMIVTCLAAAMPCQAADDAAYEQMAAKMTEAYKLLKPLPCPATDLKISNPGQAYKVQYLYVQKLAPKMGGISGYKAGLTSAVAQKKFNYNQAVSGVLFKDGLLQPNVVVPRKGHVPFVHRG